jgi:hypothetical protein
VPIDNFVPTGKLDAGFFGDDDDEPPARLPPGRKAEDEDEKNKKAAAARFVIFTYCDALFLTSLLCVLCYYSNAPAPAPIPSSNDDLEEQDSLEPVRRPVRSYDDDELEDVPSAPEPPVVSTRRDDPPVVTSAPPGERGRERQRDDSESPPRPQPRVVDDELDDFEPMSSASPSLPGVRDPSPLRKSPRSSSRRSSAPSSAGPSSAVPSPRNSISSPTKSTLSSRFDSEPEPSKPAAPVRYVPFSSIIGLDSLIDDIG